MAGKNKINVTQEMIDAVLDQMSVDDLKVAASERAMETVKEDIEIFLKTDSEQTERLARIRSVNPEWKPPTQLDRIVKFLSDKGESTKSEIIAGTGIQSGIWLTLKKGTEDNRIKLDPKTEKYSVVEEKKK